MGRSSEEFIKQREGELNSLPIIQAPFSWGGRTGGDGGLVQQQ